MLIQAYRNLNRDCVSIRTRVDGRWKVTAYRQSVAIRGAVFKVSEAGRQAVIRDRQRSVHAWIQGECDSLDRDSGTSEGKRRVTYRPYERGEFFIAETGQAVTSAAAVVVDVRGAWIG